jgi:Mor family transcriptional regulator
MVPMKKRVEEEGGKKEMITVQVKKEIIGKHEQGMQVAAISRFYKKSTSTIFHSITEERRTKGARGSKRSHESIKAMATYSGRCRKVAFGEDKREATSR